MSAIQFLTSPDDETFLTACLDAGRDASTPRIISLVGAGGKTTALFRMARALHRRGLRVTVSTTTHMLLPPPEPHLFRIVEADAEARRLRHAEFDGRAGIVAVFAAHDVEAGKVRGCAPEEIDAMKEAGDTDVILVEADGARCLGLKAPAEHEPVIPLNSDLVIAVMAGEMLLRPLQPEAVHRWPLFAERAGLKPGGILDEAALSRLLAHAEGPFKATPPRARRHWLINARAKVKRALPDALQSLMRAHAELDGLWLGDLRADPPFTHAWLRAEENR